MVKMAKSTDTRKIGFIHRVIHIDSIYVYNSVYIVLFIIIWIIIIIK